MCMCEAGLCIFWSTCHWRQLLLLLLQAFDELLLLKRGGRAIYCGPTGHESQRLIDYFEAHPGVQPIPEGTNPASWMLEVSSFSCSLHREAELLLPSTVYIASCTAACRT